MDFIITGLPRSRTFWTATYLGWSHDPLYRIDSIDDLKNENFVDTVVGRYYNLFSKIYPSAKWIVILRDPQEVRKSLKAKMPKLDLSLPLSFLDMDYRLLKQIPASLTIPFHKYNESGEQLHKVLNLPFNKEKWKWQCEMNVQVPDLQLMVN